MSPSSLLIFLAGGSLCLTAITADHLALELADENFVSRQKTIYELLWHLDQPEAVNPELYAEGKAWDIKANLKSYNSSSTVSEFLEIYEIGMLPRGEVFSLFYPAILDETVALYRLFRTAIDFETFQKTAAWARVHINEWQFAYALSVAVIHRPDTKYIKLPLPYEVNPYLFFESSVIRQAHLTKMNSAPGSLQEPHVILGNHSLWYAQSRQDREQDLNYFVEDIDLSAYYYFLNLEHPFWMSGDELKLAKTYRGEHYYYCLNLLLTRYNLERLSNDLGEVEDIDWHDLRTVGYHPFMTYSNGLHFPQRDYDSPVPLNKRKLLREAKILESRILAAIDTGFILDVDGKMENIYTPEGFDILGNIIEGNADSYNKQLYDSIDAVMRNIFGFNPDPLNKHQILPSALQHYSTSLRDPAFWRLIKKVVGYFQRYKSNIEPYNREELGNSSGLEIRSVVFDKLETYFDHADVVVDNAIRVRNNDEGITSKIRIRQYRLNHKPFSYSININAKNDTTAMIRIFLGPKYDVYNKKELDLTDNYKDFYEFDMWKVDLKAGQNTIKRSSHEAFFVAPDHEGADIFYAKLKSATEKLSLLTYSKHVYGFPGRLILPKGKKEGLTLQVFVHVIPFTKETFEIESPLWGTASVDGRSMGFPLDRPIMSAKNFNLSNAYTQNVVIFHKEMSEINATV